MENQNRHESDIKTLKIRSGLAAGKGLGDVVADFTHATHLDYLAECYTNVSGNDCGCDSRRQWLNQVFPG